MISYEDQKKITLANLEKFNAMKIDFPDFQAMGEDGMIEFIIQNNPKTQHLYKTKEILYQRLKQLENIDLECWCKEIYVQYLDYIKREVTSNPSSIICKSWDVE